MSFELKEGQSYNRKQIAEWFEITPDSFSRSRDDKLEELKDYAEFTIETSKGGNFKSIKIGAVFCPIYYKSYKGPFLKWLKLEGEQDPWYITGDEGVSNITVVTNYYCYLNKIDYDGPHYIWIEDEGKSYDGRRKVKESKKVPNPEYSTWHYLHRIAWNHYASTKKIDKYAKIDCCADSFNPISIKQMREQEKIVYKEIYRKYYGNIEAADAAEVEEYVQNIVDTMTAEQIKEEMLQLSLIKQMSDKDKKAAVVQECIEKGVLQRKGYFKEGN